jgi:hypothetical protein
MECLSGGFYFSLRAFMCVSCERPGYRPLGRSGFRSGPTRCESLFGQMQNVGRDGLYWFLLGLVYIGAYHKCWHNFKR